jgi:HSP20 family molecular chaperone IbpA
MSFYPRGTLSALTTEAEFDQSSMRRGNMSMTSGMFNGEAQSLNATRRDVWLNTQEGLQLAFRPFMDVYDDGRHYVIHLEVPGTPRDHIQVDIKEFQVCIQGEVKPKEEQRAENQVWQERKLGKWIRNIPLPQRVKPDANMCKLENGVLEIRVQKEQEGKSVKAKVQ